EAQAQRARGGRPRRSAHPCGAVKGATMVIARQVSAIEIDLRHFGKCLLVQRGLDWNGLREYECISPPMFNGDRVIAVPTGEGGPLSRVFDEIFGKLGEDLQIVMATPGIAEALRALKASET